MRIRTHPGEVLREEYLVPLGMSATALAENLDVPPNRITDIVRGHRDVTADTALRFAKFFDTTPEFWMNLQAAHDLSKAEIEQKKRGWGIGREKARLFGSPKAAKTYATAKVAGEAQEVSPRAKRYGSWIERGADTGRISLASDRRVARPSSKGATKRK